MKSDYPELRLNARQSSPFFGLSGAFQIALENPAERFIPTLVVLITASGRQDDKSLVFRINQVKEVGKLASHPR